MSSTLEQIKEEIAFDLISKYESLYESEGEFAANEWLSNLTEEQFAIFEETYWQGVKRRAGEVAGYADKAAEYVVPYYRAGKKAYRGDWSGAAKDAAVDTALLGAGAVVGKLAKGAYSAYKAGQAAKTVAPSALSSVSNFAKGVKAAAPAAAKVATTATQKLAAIGTGAVIGKAAADASNQKQADLEKATEPTPAEKARMDAAKTATTTPDRLSAISKSAEPVAAAAAKPAAATPSTPSTSATPSSDSTKKRAAATPSQRTSSRSSDTSGSVSYNMLKGLGAPDEYAKTMSRGMMEESQKPSIKDFRMLQEKIMRKNNGSI